MLTPWKESYEKSRQRLLKSRDITLLIKVHLVKAVVFPVVMYGYESWAMKKTQQRRMEASELWCWEKTLESPLDSKKIQPVNPKGNQPWIFIGRTDALAEAPILWLPDAKRQPNGKDPDTGKIEGRRRRRQQGMRQLDSIANSMCMNLSKLQETVEDRGAWHVAIHGVTKSWTWLSNWTTKPTHICMCVCIYDVYFLYI